jgi:YidC/Oxa1 family membrane protein insertase
MQRRIMFALPFVFAVFIINFPAGLIVYWITTNVWTIGQQLAVKKLFPKPEPRDFDAEAKEGEADKPARGKPTATPAAAAAVAGDAGKSSAPKASADNGGAAKGPPPNPRKKKKRSGRRR